MSGGNTSGDTRTNVGRSTLLRNAAVLGGAIAICSWLTPSLHSWTFLFAGDDHGVNIVAHPPGYTGGGGEVRVAVGIDPASAHAEEMVQPVRNIVATFNDLAASTGNLVRGAGNNVPRNHIDFESVALHEIGHALGLGHPNLATESKVPFKEQEDYTKTTKGANGSFDLDPGRDAVIGSSDDVRGDDVNLHWFRRSNNDPFTIAPTVDSTTYGRDLADLPDGHRFAANADRLVGRRLGVASSEAVMQQGTFPGEAQRTLGHDDVAGLRYAMSGVDERSGTADDYVLVLEYAGLDDRADIVLEFDDRETEFAVAETWADLRRGHAFIVDSRVYFNDSFNWFFNPEGDAGGGGPDLVVQSTTVSDRVLVPGQSFTYSATVRNRGGSASAATTLSFRGRPRGGAFTVVHTDLVGRLSPSETSERTAGLTAPRQLGPYEYDACVAAVSGEDDTGNNCSTVVSVTVSIAGGCTNDLGVVSGTVTRTGSWDGRCPSVHYASGEYARYYSFRLNGRASVTIDLTSPSVDTWLALRNGPGTGSGGLIADDDDGGDGGNSRISRTLTAGTYTIEATTFSPRRTGLFTLTLAVDAGTTRPDLVVQSPAVSDAVLAGGESFTFSATVRNQGDAASAATVLSYRQRRRGESWTVLGATEVDALSPSGTSVESIGLTAPAEAGDYEYGACVAEAAGESDTANNCSVPVPVVVRAGPDLVVETPTVSDGSLTSGQSFTLSATVRNRGGSEAEATTLTYRHRRAGGSWVEAGAASVDALPAAAATDVSIHLTAPARAGAYEYGACVSAAVGESRTANNCSGPVQVGVCVVDSLGSATVERRVVGSWGVGCGSTRRPGSYARYYSFVLDRAAEVRVGLASTADTYLFLLEGAAIDGEAVASNDDFGAGDSDSRIVTSLPAGTYTVEATTYSAGVTGSFALRVGERRPFTDDPIVAGVPVKAVHVTELRERIDELRVSAGLPRYPWVDRTIVRGVTPVKALHWERMRAALGEVYDREGRPRPRYAAAVRTGVPIEAGHVDELRRAVEGL